MCVQFECAQNDEKENLGDLQRKTVNLKKKRLIITLELKFDIIDQYEQGYSNLKIEQDVGMTDFFFAFLYFSFL